MKNRVVTFEDFINEASLTGNMEIKEFVNESTDSDMKDFETKLAKHDWYYEMSDDPRSYKAGKAEEADIIASIKKIGKKAEDIYVKMYKKMFPDSKYTPRII